MARPGRRPVSRAVGLALGVLVLSAGTASADAIENLRQSDRLADGGRCDSAVVWAGTLDGNNTQVPLYFPPQSPVVVTPADPVTVEFQMWPPEATARVYYRVARDAAYQPLGNWQDGIPATAVGPVGNNVRMRAVIPAVGGESPARVDYYIEATLQRDGTVHRCEVVDNPFDFDDNDAHHIFSYVAATRRRPASTSSWCATTAPPTGRRRRTRPASATIIPAPSAT